TGVGYCLSGPFTLPACQNAPAGACPCVIIADGNHASAHNNNPNTADYDYWKIAPASLADTSAPLFLDTSTGQNNYGGGVALPVAAMIFVSPGAPVPPTPTPTPIVGCGPSPTPTRTSTTTPTSTSTHSVTPSPTA